MSARSFFAFLIILASLCFLFPGLVKAMITIETSTELPMIGKVELYKSTQSIMQTIEHLYLANNYLVAFLILLFSVIVPFTKAFLLLTMLLVPSLKYRFFTHKIVNTISKWSMADVFVVSVLIALLSTNSNSAIDATLHEGFYYFTTYCLLSILGAQLIDPSKSIFTKSR